MNRHSGGSDIEVTDKNEITFPDLHAIGPSFFLRAPFFLFWALNPYSCGDGHTARDVDHEDDSGVIPSPRAGVDRECHVLFFGEI